MQRSFIKSPPWPSVWPQVLDTERIASWLVKGAGLLISIAVLEMLIKSPTGLRAVTAGLLFITLTLLIWKAPKIGVGATFLFLVLLGGIRRWLIPDFGWPTYDPFVIVGAAIPLISFLPLLLAKKIPTDTPLSKLIQYFVIIMAIQFFNPLQGGLLVGVGGILYYMAPALWFYVGRTYGSSKILTSLFKVVVVGYTGTAIYGLKQVLFGLAPSEQEWVRLGGYQALNVSANAIRVFSTYASQQEYAIALACGLSICITFLIFRRVQYVALVPVLGLALLLTAARGPIVGLLLAGCIQWASLARKRSLWLPRLGFAMCVAVVGLAWSLSGINTSQLDAGQRDIIAHQQEGLLDPANSTAPGHVALIGIGLMSGFKNPIGYGLGSTTFAAGKLGDGALVEGATGTESDYGNIFVSLGLAGGTIYLLIMFWSFKACNMLWRQTREVVYLAAFGVLVVCWGQWLSGGLYSLCFIVWFSIGVIDREFAIQPAIQAELAEKTKKRRKPALSRLTRRNSRRKGLGAPLGKSPARLTR